MLGVIALVHFVSAGIFVPGDTNTNTPPVSTPYQFLDVSATGQTKQGWLRLGGSGDPVTTLDVLGTTATNTLGVIGNATVVGKLHIGGNIPPAASDPALVITGGFARSSQLTGIGDRPLCATAAGLIKVCGTTTAPTGVCGSANSTTPVASAPTTGLCSTGTASSVTSGTSAYSWTCTLGMTTPTTACSVPKTGASTNCGTNNGTFQPSGTLPSPSAPNMCKSGSSVVANSLVNTGGNIWTWQCSNTPTPSSCSFTISATTCGSVNGTTPSINLSPSAANLCTGTITPNNFSSTDPVKYTWECWNATTSTSSMCSATKPISWNSSACDSYVYNLTSPNGYGVICPNATYNGTTLLTYDKEVNGTLSNVSNVNNPPASGTYSSSFTGLGNASSSGGQTIAEIKLGIGQPDLKTVRFRAKSGTLLGDWGPYKAYFKPINPIVKPLTFPLGKIQFDWSLSSNENTNPLPQVISYRILACDPTGGSDCIIITGTVPGLKSTYIDNPVAIGWNTPYPYHTTAGSTHCSIVYTAGAGGSVPCEYYIQAYIGSPFLPNKQNGGGALSSLVNKLNPGGQNPPVYYSSDMIQFP